MTKPFSTSRLTGCCPTNLQSEGRPLLSEELAGELENLFKILSNSTRLRMLHAMVCCREICVTELAERLGMKPQAVSNQLQRLVDRRIVSCRRSGSNIFYTFVDPSVQILLERGLCLIEDNRNAGTANLMDRSQSRTGSFAPDEKPFLGSTDEPTQSKGNIGDE